MKRIEENQLKCSCVYTYIGGYELSFSGEAGEPEAGLILSVLDLPETNESFCYVDPFVSVADTGERASSDEYSVLFRAFSSSYKTFRTDNALILLPPFKGEEMSLCGLPLGFVQKGIALRFIERNVLSANFHDHWFGAFRISSFLQSVLKYCPILTLNDVLRIVQWEHFESKKSVSENLRTLISQDCSGADRDIVPEIVSWFNAGMNNASTVYCYEGDVYKSLKESSIAELHYILGNPEDDKCAMCSIGDDPDSSSLLFELAPNMWAIPNETRERWDWLIWWEV